MKKTILVAGSLIVLLGVIVLTIPRREKSPLSPSPQPSGDFTITGVLRTSGLSEEEATRLDLENVRYQVTDFISPNQAPDGYFLLSRDIDQELLGTCVRLSAHNPRQESGQEFSYNRSAVMPVSLIKVPVTDCSPYLSQTTSISQGTEKITVRGKLAHGTRPAPDIGYDYKLELAEPLVREDLSEAEEPLRTLAVVPSTDSLWRTLTQTIDKNVEIEGYLLWGYAEYHYLYAERIRLL